MDSLLTANQLWAAWKQGYHHPNYNESDGKKQIAIAQDTKTKWKLVKWIDKRKCPCLSEGYIMLQLSEDEWQALRKKVGLD